MSLDVLALARRQEKEIKVLNIGKSEAKLMLFADDLIVCIENPKEYKNRLWVRISEFIKCQCTKENQVYFYLLPKIILKLILNINIIYNSIKI